MNFAEQTEQLCFAPLNAFADWPNREIPNVCSGVYAIYDDQDNFIYVGMAGASLTARVVANKIKNGKKSGLYDRLNSHASGYRSGDRFNIYIGDLYVLKTLASSQIRSISDKSQSFDSYIRDFIRSNLHYRYLITPNTIVRGLEAHIQKNGIRGDKPTINSRD